ncbi:hypothetical protein PHYPSEUDO_008770 [Phytophthora pseudosyringae]|uniref:Uncharacterized protein n=1 Tax=Phytophthora pseudosyringae TaxID=221518 RepID=A0A8T1VIN8_9STRA|nr:hypothetical protein PHYPSEUDO_008770 [Phytophthora pseudosyringae]
MTKTIFSPGSAIQRAKPLFELSDAGVEINGKRVKKPSTTIELPAPVERVVPFDSETILEAVDCAPGTRLGSSATLTNLSLEVADLQDLYTETTTLIDGEHPAQGTQRQPRRNSEEATNASTGSVLSLTPSRSWILLAPLKAPPQSSRGVRSRITRSAPRVAQRYQLRHPDDLIAEASERRQIVDELLELDSQRRRKEEELARIYKREKEAEAQRVQYLKVIRTHAVPKKTKPYDLPFTDELLRLQHTQHEMK